MGLDITAWSHMRVRARSEFTLEEYEDWHFWDNHVEVYDTHRWPYSQAALAPVGSFYEATEKTKSMHALSMSYVRYSDFRASLARSAGYEPVDAWNDPASFSSHAFVEIVNFSDCEGLIDCVSAKNLHSDFVTHRDDYRSFLEKNAEYILISDRYMQVYDDLTAGLELAAQDGLLDFH